MIELSPQTATLLTALLAGLIVIYIARLNAKRTASAKFRECLLKAFVGMYPQASEWPKNVSTHLESKFPELQAAVQEYRYFVPWYSRWAFDKAWLQYRCSTGRKIDIQCYHHYIGFSNMPDPKKTFHENVAKLLSYARTT